jgi:hypothetical protein
MGTYRETFLYDFPTSMAFLRCEASRNLYHLMTSPRSLISKYLDKGSPTGIGNTLCQMMILEHAVDIQVFYADAFIALCVGFGGLEEEVAALAFDFEMGFGAIARCLASSPAPLLASAELALLAAQSVLTIAVIARIGNRRAVGINQEVFQADIEANSRMGAGSRCFLVGFLFCRLTDNKSIPVAVSPQDEMRRLGHALDGSVQLDFQEQAQLRGHMQVLAVAIQPHVPMFGILAKLDAMPAVGLFEARETARNAHFFAGQIPFERLIQPVCQGLDRCGGHMLASAALKGGHQVVLEEKLAGLGILRFCGFQHLVVQATRILQAGHQLLALYVVGIETIFKRSHALMILYRANVVNKRQGRISSHSSRLRPSRAQSW